MGLQDRANDPILAARFSGLFLLDPPFRAGPTCRHRPSCYPPCTSPKGETLMSRLVAASVLLMPILSWGAAPPPRPAGTLERFFAAYDKNKGGFIDRAECPEAMRKVFAKLD